MAGIRPGKRKRIAQREGIEETREIGILQGELRGRRKQFEKETGSLRGATSMAQRSLQGIPTNLKGPEGRQLRQEIRGRGKDLARDLPGLIAVAQQEYKSDRGDIMADISQQQFNRRQDISSALKDLVEHQKKEAKTEAEDIAENQAEKRRGVQSAINEAVRMFELQRDVNTDPEADEGEKRGIPATAAEWRAFEEGLRKREGIDERSARKAVKKLQRRLGPNPEEPLEVIVRRRKQFVERLGGWE
jgi:gas vesicle protein